MGAVYLGRDEALERLVAIKVLPPEHGQALEWRERFRREARTAARLTHPILVEDETGRALLADFGVAKAAGGGQTVTQAGGIVGTPDYMSPEQAAGAEAIDGRSDIYSLGTVAYGMLTGRLPFEGPTPQDVLLKRLTAEPAPLGELAPELPGDLAAAVMRCLAREREARWPDARGLRDAVAPRGLDEDQLAKASPGRPASTRRPFRAFARTLQDPLGRRRWRPQQARGGFFGSSRASRARS